MNAEDVLKTVQAQIHGLVSEWHDGHGDAFRAVAFAKALAIMAEDLLKDEGLLKAANSELGKQGATCFGLKLEASTSHTYLWKEYAYPAEISAKMEEANRLKKAVEDAAKLATKTGHTQVATDTETGECWEVGPVLKTEKDTVKAFSK